VRSGARVAGVELRRFLRDRSNIFFVFVFPLLLVR
jgi:ABC-2 type transport system permease protein